jgi:hypothetical protein
MVRFCFFPVFFLFFFILPVNAAPQMVVELDRTVIYEGETIAFRVTVVDSQTIDGSVSPDISTIADFNVQTLPKQPSTQRFVQIINGVRSETTESRVRFTYILTPKKNGTLSIPEPKVVINGQTLRPDSVRVGKMSQNIPSGGAIPVTVRAPNDQDLVFMKIEADRFRLYPFQLLTVTLVVQIKSLPEKIDADQSKNPLQVLSEPPRLTIPWANKDNSLPKGVIPIQELNDWLTGLNLKHPQGGFSINDYASESIGFDDWFRSPFSHSPLSGMTRQTLYQFAPSPQKIKRKDLSGQDTTYWEFRFNRTFRMEEIGRFSFGAVTLKGALAAAALNSPQGVAATDIYALAQEIQVEVVDVPQEDRPKDYLGAFGIFDWSVDLQPRQAKVGDPMTLTLRLTGQGSTANVQAPDLLQNPEVTANFKVYPPTEEVNDKSCTFTYAVRPTKEGAIVFPPLSVTFFNVEKEQFESRRSEPIPLEISEAKILQTVPAFGGLPSSPDALKRSEKGLFANMTDPRGAVNQSVNYVHWAVTLVSLTVIYVFLALGVFLWRLQNANPKRRRRRGAFSRAQQRLITVSTSLHRPTSVPEAVNLLQGVFFGYVADLTGGIEHGMTSQDACRKLTELGVTEKTVGCIRKQLETLDAARYGGLNLQQLDKLTAEGNILLKQLQNEIKL